MTDHPQPPNRQPVAQAEQAEQAEQVKRVLQVIQGIQVNPLNGGEWVTFPGGELEGKRPRVQCPACRERLRRAAAGAAAVHRSNALCFQCYRAELEREKALTAAGQLDTASDERFQFGLPFEPVDRPRLEMLKVDRAATRAAQSIGAARFGERRRQAQIAARRALQSIAAGLRMQKVELRAADFQLPESWLPFVVSR